MLGCARAPRRCAGEVPLGVEPAPALAPLRSAFLPFDALLVVVPISRWTTRDTQIRGRCALQKEHKDVKHGCEIKMAHFVRMNEPPLRVKL